jgi:small-conductance mechanosensitive channel
VALNFLDIPAGARVALHMAIIILTIAIIGKIGVRLIDSLMRPERLPGAWDERRVNTLRGLARSLLKYTLYFIGGVMLLDELGVPTTSILAGAGILGLAVGFGAQNLVRDVITGFFILFEDQFAVGDYVTFSGVTGTVTEMGLRVTRVQSWTGEIHIIPNGKIEQVTNYSRGGMGVLLEVDVAYEVELDHAIEIINSVCHEMAQEKADQVIEEPQVLGVTELSPSGVTIQIFGKVNPMQQWGFARELRKRIKDAFDREGIEIPYPHRVIISKQGKGEENGPEAL